MEGGQRSASQVLANSLGGAALAVVTAWLQRSPAGGAVAAGDATACTCSLAPAGPVLAAAFVGFYACCCADTWSSEVGIASSTPPRLLTTLRVRAEWAGEGYCVDALLQLKHFVTMPGVAKESPNFSRSQKHS